MTMPSRKVPNQKISFSAALKRCDGSSLPLSMPPAFASHFRSPWRGKLSRTKVMNTITSDTTKSGPKKLCDVLST